MSKEERCAKTFYHAFTPSRCKRKGVIEEAGKLWCWQHAPSAEKRREDEMLAHYDAKREERRKQDMERAWNLVIGKLRRMNPKLAEEVRRMATKDGQAT